MDLIQTIINKVAEARTQTPVNHEFYRKQNQDGPNEFLFILKPEIFAKISTEQSSEIISLIMDRMKRFDFSIDNARVLNAAYLKKYDVIDKHYGVINAASKNFAANVSREVTQNFEEFYQKKLSDATVLGSLELANHFPDISDEILQQLWGKVEIKRLAGGIYSGEIKHKGETIYIVNGFHPPQLQHFTDENRVIVTMNLSSSTDWSVARKELIGSTYPEKAHSGSLRGDIYRKYGKMGFEDVSHVINGVHLSAGPLEGVLELQRFNSDFQNQKICNLTEFAFGKRITENFTQEILDRIVQNPMVNFNGNQSSLFDLTEEKNPKEALDLLKSLVG